MVERKNQNEIIEIHLLDYVALLVRHRWLLIRNVLLAAILGAIISFVLPKKYTATTTILPPTEESGSNLQSLLSDVAIPMMPLKTGHSTAELFVEILRSRSVREGVLNRKYVSKSDTVTLFDIFRTKSYETATGKLSKATCVLASNQGVISISVEMSTPQLAAQVANAFVAELDIVNQQKSTSRAKNSRLYIENQLRMTEQRLGQASQSLAEFQQKHNAISLEDQIKSWIEQAGQLQGQIISTEIELGVLLQTMKPDNPTVLRKQRQVDEMRTIYAEMQLGGDSTSTQHQKFSIPFTEVPAIGLQLAELLREVKVQETVWQLLNQQYYQAKIQEARDTPTVQVLDEAVPPERASKPKRRVIVLVLGLLAGILSVLWIFGEQYFVKVSARAEEKQKLIRIATEFKNDFEKTRTVFQSKIFSRKR